MMRERIFQIVQHARPGDKLSHAYDIFIVSVAFLSIIPLMFRPQDAGRELTFLLNMLDVVTVYVLLFDYIMRWATHDIKTGKRGWKEFAKYPFTPLALIDLLAILPSLGVLPEAFKFLRVLRVTKMFRYSKNLTIVANVLRSERKTLLSVLVVALMYIYVSGLIMFTNEPETFDNFFDALYWATTALTTVGYGDVYPVTDLGKFISMASSLFGIAIIALPAGIVTGGFLEQIRQSQENGAAYFQNVERPLFKRRSVRSYGSAKAFIKARPKVVAYALTMLACFLINELMYSAAVLLGTPVWLDTTGTALAAILLEPAAALVVAFANNLIQAIQFGNAGNLLYYGLGAIAAVVYGVLFSRGKKLTPRSLGLAAVFLVGVGTVISVVLTFLVSDGQLSTGAQRYYAEILQGVGSPSIAAIVGALFIDKLIDAVAVFILVKGLLGVVVGSPIDPARWTKEPGGTHTATSGKAEMTNSQEHNKQPNAANLEPNFKGDEQQASHSERYVLGIDVGGTHTKLGAFTLEGKLVTTHTFDSQRVLNDGSHAQLSREMLPVLEEVHISADQVAAVGLAVPGSVAAEESLKMCPNLDLDLRSYKAFLHALFPQARVSVLNDADAAVLGDWWHGRSSDRPRNTVVFITLGTGLGGGIMSKGSLLTSLRGGVGEVGHLCVNPYETQTCSCGKKGCLEQYASATSLVRMAREEWEQQHSDAGGAAQVFPHARAVLDAVERRDPAAQAALARFTDALGFGLAQIACLIDPDEFVLGGGLSERAPLFIRALKARYRACAIQPCRDTPIEASPLGNRCGVYGAAFRALDSLEAKGREV